MALAKIFKPSKSTMQSGRAKYDQWVLEWEQTSATRPDRLMGWTASSDMQTQCQLHFDSQEDAVAYAQTHGLAFRIIEPSKSRHIIKAYADNFASNRREPWTH